MPSHISLLLLIAYSQNVCEAAPTMKPGCLDGSVERPALVFSSGHDLESWDQSPASGSGLCVQQGVCVRFSLAPLPACSLFLSLASSLSNK